MKKRVRIILFCIIFSLLTVIAAQANDDIFYCKWNDKEFEDSYELLKDNRNIVTTAYLSKHYLPEGQEVDPDKIVYETDKTYFGLNWQAQQVIDFLKAEDKISYLNSLYENHKDFTYIPTHICPIYYDGELLEDYAYAFYYSKTNERYRIGSTTGALPEHLVLFSNKTRILQLLEQDGITGYDVIQSINLGGLRFVAAEKEGTLYTIFVPYNVEQTPTYHSLYQQQGAAELLDKRILTVAETEALLSIYINMQTENAKRSSDQPDLMGGAAAIEDNAAQTNTPTLTDDDPPPSIHPALFIVFGVVLLSAVVTLIIILYRKKVS